MNILCIQSFCPQKTHKRTLISGSILLKHGRHIDYRNQPMNMLMRVCYLDCHKVGLCYYLVIHIEHLLRPLQQFLLPFVTYLLTLPRISQLFKNMFSL
jgi:hypothetical protein